jgi:hypothetical protein
MDPGSRAPDIEPEGEMVTDLEAKAEKYDSRAAQYYELAVQAPEGPQRTFFEVLAAYYEKLATDFRQANARRSGRWVR